MKVICVTLPKLINPTRKDKILIDPINIGEIWDKELKSVISTSAIKDTIRYTRVSDGYCIETMENKFSDIFKPLEEFRRDRIKEILNVR